MNQNKMFKYSDLVDRATALLTAAGATPKIAAETADGLVEADARALPSHGLMLLPMYLDRIAAGSVDPQAKNETLADLGALVSVDSHNGLGHATAADAMTIAVERAKQHGVGIVVCKRAFHFGGAYRYVEMATKQGMIGIAAANTRPLMPAPGGSKALVGNNPISIGAPTSDAKHPIIFDIALSEAAMGKIRIADAEEREIPLSWATDSAGNPTADPAEAIKGMLLPAGGAKGFGLALMVDVLTGILSGGGYGATVNGLYGDMAIPYNSANFFMAIDAERLDPDFSERVSNLADQVKTSPMVNDTEKARVPGQRGQESYYIAQDAGVHLNPSVQKSLTELEEKFGLTTGTKNEG